MEAILPTPEEPSRRSFMGHLAGIAATAGLVYGCTDIGRDAHPDATLLSLLDQAQRLWDADMNVEQPHGQTLAELLAPRDWARSLNEASATRAQTQDGIRAKADAIRAMLVDRGGTLPTFANAQERLMLSLCQDIARLSGGVI
jgi:hypothetical protein